MVGNSPENDVESPPAARNPTVEPSAEQWLSSTSWTTRRRILVAVLIVAGIVLTSIVVLSATGLYPTRPLILDSAGEAFGVGPPAWYSALDFYTGQPGTLTGAWNSTPPTTAYVFLKSTFNGSNFQESLWAGRPNVTSDSISFHVDSGSYVFVWVATNQTAGSDVHVTQSIIVAYPSGWP
jgi:hypothetical protein